MRDHDYVLYFLEPASEEHRSPRWHAIGSGTTRGYEDIIPMKTDEKRKVLADFPQAKQNLYVWVDERISFKLD